jgi:TPR repeat protein
MRFLLFIVSIALLVSPALATEPDRTGLTTQAETGSAQAQLDLARSYRDGISEFVMSDQGNADAAATDFDLTLKWYRKAVQSDEEAIRQSAGTELAELYVLADYENGLQQLRDADLYGAIYVWAKHQKWQPKQFPTALNWYEKAANGGETRAMMFLANIYNSGWGQTIAAEPAKGLFWYEKAAAAGDLNAMYQAALIYEYGFGDRDPDFEIDTDKSWAYLLQAANGGQTDAQIWMVKKLIESEQYQFGSKYINPLLQKKNRLGQFYAGVFFENGYGFDVDKERALLFYQLAADQGHVLSRGAVKRLQAELSKTAQ